MIYERLVRNCIVRRSRKLSLRLWYYSRDRFRGSIAWCNFLGGFMKVNFPRILKEDIVMPLAVGWLFGTGYVENNRFSMAVAFLTFCIMLSCDIWEWERDLE